MKNITERQDRRNLETMRTTCNVFSCHNFALLLHENALVFSQLEACNFSNYVIIKQKKCVHETAESAFKLTNKHDFISLQLE